jgi:hypothetical protein
MARKLLCGGHKDTGLRMVALVLAAVPFSATRQQAMSSIGSGKVRDCHWRRMLTAPAISPKQ